MTTDNTPQFATGHSGSDLFYDEAQVLANRRAPSQNYLNTFRIRDPEDQKKYLSNVVRWELVINDLSGGLDQQYGPLSNRMAAQDGVDGRWARTLCLSPLINTATTPDPASIQNISAVDVFDASAIGIGTMLLKPTSATDWAPTQLTYTPGGSGVITNLYRGAVGGTTAQLWVMGSAANIEILSDLAATPTSAGSISSTNPAWWGIESPLNDSTPGAVTHMLNVGATLVVKVSDNTLTTAPANPLAGATTWHGGGYAVDPHMFALGGKGRLQGFVVKPRTHRTSSMLSVSTALGDIFYINAYAGDPLMLKLPIPVRLARRWRNGIVASDHRSVYWHNGNVENLHYAYEREPVTEREYLVGDIMIHNDRLYVWTIERNLATDAPSRFCMEEYSPEKDGWDQVTAWVTVTGGQGDIIPSVSNIVAREHSTVYRNSAAYIYDDTRWRYVQLTPPDWNPYYMSRNTGSATAGVVYPFATSGSGKSAVIPLDRLEGYPSVVYEVQCLGELRGTFSSGYPLRVDIARQTSTGMSFDAAGTHRPTFTFTGANVFEWSKNITRNMANQDTVDKLQLRLTLTQGSETRISSNALPIIVRGVCFLDRVIKPLQSILGDLPEAA